MVSEQERTGHRDVCPARLEAGDTESPAEVQAGEQLAGAVDVFGRHPLVAERRGGGAAILERATVPRLSAVPDVPIDPSNPATRELIE